MWQTSVRANVLFVSFSGVDGSGKSTQIAALRDCLEAAGARVAVLTFWDDVATLARVRDFTSHALFRGDRGAGVPGKPIVRRDKNVRTPYMAALRLGLYVLDAVHLNLVFAKVLAEGVDAIIFDRYLYDELANLPLDNLLVRGYVRLLLSCVPRPDVAFVLDAEPEMACQRKPEYPLEFVCRHRRSYFAVQSLAREMIVVPPSSVAEVQQKIAQELRRHVPANKLSYLGDESSTLRAAHAFRPQSCES